MGFFYWFRVAIMIASFVMIVMVIRSLNQGKLIPGSQILTEQPTSEPVYKLCPTRVTKIRLASGETVFEEKMRWYRDIEGQRQEIDPVSIERWFSQNCSKNVYIARGDGHYVEITYVNGEIAPLDPTEELNGALRTLLNLPAPLVPGRARPQHP